MSTGKRYTDNEVHAIFERAAARQDEAERAEDASRAGLSLTELQQIGQEAGIDPAHIALAASELGVSGVSPVTPQQDSFIGIPTRLSTSRVINGHISDDAWERMVLELRNIYGRDGIAGEIGKVREWTVTSSVGRMDRPVKVTLKPEETDTLVIVNQELKGQAIGFSIGTAVYLAMGLLMVLVNLLSTSGDPPPIGVGMMFLGMATLFFGGALFGTRIYAKSQQTKFARTLDRIELIAGSSAAEETLSEAARPQIDLDALPDAGQSVAEEAQRRHREHE